MITLFWFLVIIVLIYLGITWWVSELGLPPGAPPSRKEETHYFLLQLMVSNKFHPLPFRRCRFFCRFLPQCIGYVLKRKFNIKIRFGRIGLPFSLRDVNICKSGFSVVSLDGFIGSTAAGDSVAELYNGMWRRMWSLWWLPTNVIGLYLEFNRKVDLFNGLEFCFPSSRAMILWVMVCLVYILSCILDILRHD